MTFLIKVWFRLVLFVLPRLVVAAVTSVRAKGVTTVFNTVFKPLGIFTQSLSTFHLGKL